ncbi:response regulator transcription factor [Parasulfuritortus cantonensis]|uniref:Response regulator transcription factor n=2 Tax=Parasulfuritortus cantonensis TaxID=2528202 RepID=A0A4R1BD26_9PROT|nr:response regulator transcription factor [Parasulfuritortus cantonensis]
MRILFADDHPLFREGVKPVLLKLAPDVEIIEAKDYPAAFEAARQHQDIDLALLDLYMPGMPGIDGIARFRASFPHLPVAVLSAADERENIQRLLGDGVLGYISKASPSDVILNALKLMLAGGVYVPPSLLDDARDGGTRPIAPEAGRHEALTRRQVEVLRELAKGLNNRQIAHNLNVTEGTVKIHLATIFRVLNVNSRTEALLLAQKMGLGGKD